MTSAERAAALEAFVGQLVGAVPPAPPLEPQPPPRSAPRVDPLELIGEVLRQFGD